MLVAPRIRVIGAADCLNTGKVFAITAPVAAKDDYAFSGVFSRAPIPIVLMIADRLRESVFLSEKIDRSRLSITVGKNGGYGALLGRELIVNSAGFFRHFLPPEFIGEILWQRSCGLILG